MVEVDGATPLIGERGAVTLLDAFEGRRMLIAYYFMWHTGHPAPEQCEGCTWVTSQVRELSYIHSRDVTYATFCQGPYEESARYRDFMGWEMPWYSAQDSLDTLLVGRRVGRMHIVCYLRQGSKVFETYWTTRRGVEAMDNSYRLLDLTVYGRQETWEDSPAGWPQRFKGKQNYPYRWTSHRPVVSPEGRVFGRPGNRQALNGGSSRRRHSRKLQPEIVPDYLIYCFGDNLRFNRPRRPVNRSCRRFSKDGISLLQPRRLDFALNRRRNSCMLSSKLWPGGACRTWGR